MNRQVTKSHASFPAVTYGFDLVSRRTSIAQAAGGTTVQCGYDSARRLGCAVQGGTLTSVTQSAGVVTCAASGGWLVHYRYDATNNLTRLTWPDGVFVEYTYDDANRMDLVKDAAGTVLADYGYDTLSRRTNFENLTGGTGKPAPDRPEGTRTGDNGVTIRPGKPGVGPRIDIPANGTKPPETLD